MNSITITVNTPAGSCTLEIEKTTKVQEVIDQIAEDKGLQQRDKLELTFNGEPLEPTTRPLVSFGIESGAVLTLVAAGSGV